METKKYLFGNRIKSFLDNTLQYLSLIIILPAMLGGLWQIVNLLKMGIAYIRFFSVTQMVPDGILILFILISVFLIGRIGYWLFGFKKSTKIENTENNDSNKDNNKILNDLRAKTLSFKIGFIIVSLGACALLYFIVKRIFLDVKNIENITFFEILLLPIVLALLILIGFFMISILSAVSNFDYKSTSDAMTFISHIIILISGYVMFSFLSNFNKSFIAPGDLENLSNYMCKLKQTEDDNLKFDVTYFNDTYVFIERKYIFQGDHYKSSYKIVKLEEMLEVAECK